MPGRHSVFADFAPYAMVLLLLTPYSYAQSAPNTQPGDAAPKDNTQADAEPSEPDGDEPLTTELIEESLGREQDAEGNWADSSHEYIGTRADDLAIYLDRFFGSPIEDLESAESNMRFTTGLEWDADDGTDMRFRLRGNLHLPRIDNRVSLVFNGEDDEFRGGPAGTEDDRNEVGLQVNAAESDRSRFDFTLGVSSGPNLKPGFRYRFKDDLGDWGRFRYTGRADYSDKRRFRHRHTVELDYLTGETSLLRWATKLEDGQRSDGVEWSTALVWRYGYSIDSAMAFIVNAAGKTEPDIPDYVFEDPSFIPPLPDQQSLVTTYGFKASFRNRLYKDWLYVEVEPGYTWRQRHNFEDRHGVFYGRINFEIWFNRGRKAPRKAPQSEATQAGISPTEG